MLADKVRMESYRRAIHSSVKKGDIVCDVGAGSGILTYFALKAGARKVFAIERDGVIEDAKKIAEANGWSDKIIFINQWSDRAKLPEKVDVIISELIGHFGREENLDKFLIDARRRFLKPNGRIIPSWLELYLAPVESKKLRNEFIDFWKNDFYGCDFSLVKNYATSQRYIMDCSKKVRFLSPPSLISHTDFYKIEKCSAVFRRKFRVIENGICDGFVGFFKAGLTSDITISTSPEKPLTHWKQTFFPLKEAVKIRNNDEIYCEIKGFFQRNNMFWEWNTRIYRNGSEIRKYSQSDLNIEREEILTGRTDFKPTLTQEAGLLIRTLNFCDGKRAMEDIALEIFRAYPEKYKNTKDSFQDIVNIMRGKVK
jgi:protein arginine N-methyltransferase 1